jgi:hypothetical protein
MKQIVTYKQGMTQVKKYQLSKNDLPFKSKQLTSEEYFHVSASGYASGTSI